MGSCRLLPHGGYTLIPTVMTTLAWLASLFQDGCDYARLEGPLVQRLARDNSPPFLEVGFAGYRIPKYDEETDEWNVSYAGKCKDYDTDVIDIDAAWKAAKGFAFLALVLGGGGALFLWFSSCCVFSRGTWRWAGYEVLLAATFQGFAFLWFGTEMCQNQNNCELFLGSKSDVVAFSFWLGASLAIFLKYPHPTLLADDMPTSSSVGTLTPEIAVTAEDGSPLTGDSGDNDGHTVLAGSGLT